MDRAALEGVWSSRTSACGRAAVLLGLLVSLAFSPARADDYEQRIARARQGDYAQALAAFAQDAAQGAMSARQVNDWLLISSWAQRDGQVLDIYRRYRTQVPVSSGALGAVARALRNTGEWGAAAQLYQQLLAREPDQPDWHLGAVYALADAGQFMDAQAVLERFRQRFAQRKVEGLLAQSYLLRAQRRSYAALDAADRALRAAPQSAAAKDAYLASLTEAGVPLPALHMLHEEAVAAQSPSARVRRLQLDRLAEMVRVSFTPSRAETERLEVGQRAVAHYDALLRDWDAQLTQAPHDVQLAADVRRARIDRLGAYWTARRLPALLQEYEALRAQDSYIPDYALAWVGSALLETRQPERAREIFAELLERPDQDEEVVELARSGLFYALTESESIKQARGVARQDAQQTPPQRWVPGSSAAVPSDQWAQARRNDALAEYFSDRLDAAQAELEGMLALGPGDQNTRIALASVYRDRGWPRRAADELRIAQSNDDPLGDRLLLAQASVAMDLQDWRTAEALTLNLYQRFPEEDWAQRALRSWQISRRPELQFEAGWRDSDGVSAIGEGGMDYSVVVYSAPLSYDWRLFAGMRHGSGTFPEGKGHYNQWRAGLEWRHHDTHAEFELASLRSGGQSHAGLRVLARQQLNDHWQVQGSWSLNSVGTPLRALRSGITADEGQLQLQWRAHESRSWQLGINTLHYDDGNRYTGLQLTGQERLLTRAHWHLDGGLDLATGRNTSPGGPYFAPRRDRSILPSLTLRHILHRRYERVWSQEIQVAIGRYWQQDYGSGAIEQLRYGQQLVLDEATDIGFQTGVQWRPYDGERERELFFSIDFTHRF
ncbi:hypothetical protein AAV94_03025 [Lampropedia cohaerens]|uniref:PgaA membrane beta barrel domain-containing protein n=1 Tax=Lampropedia cohaerens TaxID=1610491 RepID=A0A0U1Q2N3_9BURK|nr:poly-beta-1,6 N-acetyl-D-glucosamine export porin PgaA [Lampropedia cohaerens]KKW68905.1 hypothetical protein AAV94_03025 [Lampropedia cohaerens]